MEREHRYTHSSSPTLMNTKKKNVKHTKIPNHSMWQKCYKGENGSLLIFYHWKTQLENIDQPKHKENFTLLV